MNNAIRQAEERDVAVLARYEAEISIISFGDEAITDTQFHEKKIRKGLSQDAGGMFVLEHVGEVAGWLWMDVKTNFLTQEKYINFRSFYLADILRGSTEGDTLLSHGLEYARQMGARSVVGKVHAENMAMRALYKKAGFTATHITMECRLP